MVVVIILIIMMVVVMVMIIFDNNDGGYDYLDANDDNNYNDYHETVCRGKHGRGSDGCSSAEVQVAP